MPPIKVQITAAQRGAGDFEHGVGWGLELGVGSVFYCYLCEPGGRAVSALSFSEERLQKGRHERGEGGEGGSPYGLAGEMGWVMCMLTL